MIYVIGIGTSGRGSLGDRALKLIGKAGILAGGRRHLREFPEFSGRRLEAGADLDEFFGSLKRHISANPVKDAVILATGDPLLFGIGGPVLKRFGRKKVEIIPNVSVVQETFSRLKEPWAGLTVLSAHGRGEDMQRLSAGILESEKAAVFTDPVNTPSRIARALLKSGARGYRAYVCEAIGTARERIIEGTLAQIAGKRRFSPLNILVLIRGKGTTEAALPPLFGIRDGAFFHDSGMITKEEIRAVSISKLCLRKDSVLWDIGSGSGSVAVQAALISEHGTVYAVDKDKNAALLIEKNMRRFNTPNIKLIAGEAPGCLKNAGVARPDAVFIGGGGVVMQGILRLASARLKKRGHIVVNAVTLETVSNAFSFFSGKGWEREIIQVNISRAESVGRLNMLAANNPVFVICGTKK
ncbi:MAG: precorrin-6y C5,15-methyltransferase (decarboxylating) subunit CbiE [Deltaproteobacteria bacterium]|nr:precorrin-6y C5,15-methyltransferase (decarboxylating) subunit CbiE [Deltaproteobacteria bacterium]